MVGADTKRPNAKIQSAVRDSRSSVMFALKGIPISCCVEYGVDGLLSFYDRVLSTILIRWSSAIFVRQMSFRHRRRRLDSYFFFFVSCCSRRDVSFAKASSKEDFRDVILLVFHVSFL